MPATWCVLHCKPNKEEFVHRELTASQVDHFYPFVTVKPVNPRSRKRRPYFPGYIFVRLDIDDENQSASLRWVPGTVGLVAFDGRVAGVPDSLVNALQKRIAEIPALLAAERQFKPGDRVKLVSGPFEGYEGIFDMQISGPDRVQVLIRFLRDNVKKVNVPASILSKINPI